MINNDPNLFKNFNTVLTNNTQFLCVIFYLALLSFPSFAADDKQPQKLYFDLGMEGGWVPYHTGAETGRPGVFIDFTNKLQSMIDIQIVAVHFPPKRAEKALLDGIVDFDFICLEWLTDNQPGEGFVASESFLEINEYLVTLKKNTHLFPTRESMFGQPVGTVAGYFYFDDAEFIRVDFLNENILMQGLKHDRFKVAILERETAKYWAKLNATDIGFAALHTSGNLVMRLSKKHQALLPSINQAIRKMKASGELQAILNIHGIESKIN